MELLWGLPAFREALVSKEASWRLETNHFYYSHSSHSQPCTCITCTALQVSQDKVQNRR